MSRFSSLSQCMFSLNIKNSIETRARCPKAWMGSIDPRYKTALHSWFFQSPIAEKSVCRIFSLYSCSGFSLSCNSFSLTRRKNKSYERRKCCVLRRCLTMLEIHHSLYQSTVPNQLSPLRLCLSLAITIIFNCQRRRSEFRGSTASSSRDVEGCPASLNSYQ